MSGDVAPATPMEKRETKTIRVTEVAAACGYCIREDWFLALVGVRKVPSPDMIRGSIQHGFYEVLERDMASLVNAHGWKSAPEVVLILRDHLIDRGFKEIIPEMSEKGETDETAAKAFVIDLAMETAYLYVTTYMYMLYHARGRTVKPVEGILVRESRKASEYRGYVVSGKPDWVQYTDSGIGIGIDYKTGKPKPMDMYQEIQADGYAWLMKRAVGVVITLHIVFWQAYHKFVTVYPKADRFEEKLDWFINVMESDKPPAYVKCERCMYCSKTARELCEMQR